MVLRYGYVVVAAIIGLSALTSTPGFSLSQKEQTRFSDAWEKANQEYRPGGKNKK